MQSGISASSALHSAFQAFTNDTSLFALPITITSESLTPLPTIAFPSGSSSTLQNSLPSLSSILNPTTPLYLILRKSSNTQTLIAATYIPSRSPVRQKTLFASTRATLVRELGSEKFADTIFLTEREEVLDPKTWSDSDEKTGTASSGGGGGGTSSSGPYDTAILSTEERELQAVKRAEEEERHGTRGRDLMGEGGSGGARKVGIQINVTDEAKQAFSQIATAQSSGDTVLVQFGIEIAGETVKYFKTQQGVAPADVYKHIPADSPSYSFYVPGGAARGVLFIYVCPGTSKVKERMIYASSRRGVLDLAKAEGVVVLKNLEAGDPDELAAGRVEEEVGILLSNGGAGDGGDGEGEGGSLPGSGTATPRSGVRAAGGFARPKRPGKK